ncbi:unnamed protein product [Cylindrotheca closterium]|uniref:HSF-type DNA-binding domain-containing protein n=1 Tax=Cylindrotheca closterium TaxID=2856 RepID=A0AAD2G0Y9_9STRA|nr:unnamed protein product [Cylindrotheca closterium]
MARAIDPALLQKVAIKQQSMEMPLVPEIIQPQWRNEKADDLKVEVKKEKPKDDDTARAHIVVQHHYHDHSMDRIGQFKQDNHPARGGVITPFPLKLHEMLRDLEQDGFGHIVSWQPHGRCFVVHKSDEFVHLLPRYFKLSKLASFQRQLNLYGFQRLTHGKDRGGYYHELFLRSMPFLAQGIQRIKVKGTGVRARSNPHQEPNFYKMSFVGTRSLSVPMPLPRSRPVASFPTTFMPIPSPMSLSIPTPVMSQPAPHASLPLQSSYSLEPRAVEDFDVICGFGNKKFHYLDPHQLQEAEKARKVEMAPQNAAGFFKDFVFPSDIGVEIEDDEVFGNMLEQMIS